MSNTKIYIELSSDIEAMLTENAISIPEMLAQHNIAADYGYSVPDYRKVSGSRNKDVVLTIIASSALVFTIGLAISQVLTTINQRPERVEYLEPVEVRDADGTLLHDSNGNIIFKLVPRFQLLEPTKEDSKRQLEVNFSHANGIVIKITSSQK